MEFQTCSYYAHGGKRIRVSDQPTGLRALAVAHKKEASSNVVEFDRCWRYVRQAAPIKLLEVESGWHA